MNPLLFQCPKTGRQVTSGIQINFTALRDVQPVTVRLHCPFCNSSHEWKLTDGLIDDPHETAPVLAAWSPCPR
jgi:hypothetical protein